MAVGILLGANRFLSKAFEPYLYYLGPTPKIIFFPVMIMWFGVGPGSKVALGTLSCFFPVALSVAAGMRQIDKVLIRVGKSFRASTWQMMYKIYLPAMRHPIINGVRLGLGVALIGTLLAETKLSNKGIGFLIIKAYSTFDMPRMYAMLIVLFVLAIGANALVGRLGGLDRYKKHLKSKQRGERRMKHVVGLAAAALAMVTLAAPAAADDLVKMTIGQRGNWDTAITHLGEKAGIFKKHGMQLEMIYTSGSGETLQPVISGSVDLGLAVGTLGAMAAYSKGAPVRIIGAEATGAADYWYAKNPAIKTLKDTNGHTIAFSTNGSSTHSVVRAFIDEFKLTAKPQPTGNPSATLTAVMTDQVDVGWASPPFGLKEMEEGKIHLVARATDATLVRGQTIRVLVANADALAKRKEVIDRFMKAYRESIDYMYSANPQVMKDYAEFARVSEPLAKRVRDEFFPKSLVNPDQIHGLETSDPGGGEPEIHSRSAHQGTDRGADPDLATQVGRSRQVPS